MCEPKFDNVFMNYSNWSKASSEAQPVLGLQMTVIPNTESLQGFDIILVRGGQGTKLNTMLIQLDDNNSKELYKFLKYHVGDESDPYTDPVTSPLITIEQFKSYVKSGAFTDDDGYGYAVKDGRAQLHTRIYPSGAGSIPSDATHIVWYNR